MISNEKYIPSILIVDDIKSNLLLLSSLLDDYNVISVMDGFDAVQVAQKKHFDLIILDISMPKMDGYEVCEKLKSIEKTKDIPVVFITSNTDEDSIEKAYEVGGVDYVTKPIKSKELLARVKTQISLHSVKKALDEKISLIDSYVSYSTTDKKGIIIDVSDAFCRVSGYSKEELIGKKHNILRHQDMTDETYKDMWGTITSGRSWVGEVKNRNKNGSPFWVDVVISPRFDNNGDIYGYTAIRHDITYQKKIELLSITDQLTDLYNRRYFNDVFPVEIKRSIRQATCLSFLTLDVDYFKQFNDTYGHQEGDTALQMVGRTLKEHAKRAEDLVFRLGGEEFGIIFTSNNSDDAKRIADGIRESIEKIQIEHKSSKISKYLTVSVGLACIDFSKKQNQNINESNIYKLADDELYKAKEQGRNRISSVIL